MFFLFFSENLNKRFKHTRSTYDFSIGELSSTLELKTTSVIGNIETKKGLPSLQVLTKFAIHFGISFDWLFGLSDIVYTPESISTAEKFLVETLTANKANVPSLELNDKWLDPIMREQNYSLAVRGNIIFLAHWIISQNQPSAVIGVRGKKKCNQRYENFNKLINLHTKYPIYDIEQKID